MKNQVDLYISEKQAENHILRADVKEVELIESIIINKIIPKMEMNKDYFINFLVYNLNNETKKGQLKNRWSASVVMLGLLWTKQDNIIWDNNCSGLGKFKRVNNG